MMLYNFENALFDVWGEHIRHVSITLIKGWVLCAEIIFTVVLLFLTVEVHYYILTFIEG